MNLKKFNYKNKNYKRTKKEPYFAKGFEGHTTLSYQTFLNFLYQSFEKYGLPYEALA
jgi:hypothetical protein